MKIFLTLVVTFLLTSCVSSEQRIADFQSRCKLIGYDLTSENGKACVLELEKQYVLATSKNDVTSEIYKSDENTIEDICMFNPENNRNETCFHVTAGGSCAHFGSICSP